MASLIPATRLFATGMAITLALLAMPGCATWHDVARIVIIEPKAFHPQKDRRRAKYLFERLADVVYRRMDQSDLGDYSTDYARGFKNGFVDYLEAGGNGEPPPVPPRDYWGSGGQWRNRQSAIDDWNQGFREGAERARQSGLRDRIVVPSSNLIWTSGSAGDGGISDN